MLRQPAVGPSEAIGSAAAGCLRGAATLPLAGEGYQVLRPERNRAWGHPRTVAFVSTLAATVQSEGLPLLLIGDMAQPRGGPLPFGHASHQNGLDVDIWFRQPSQPLSPAELARPHPVSMVRNGRIDSTRWSSTQARLLELAATSPDIDRIFVNPAIKLALCRSVAPERRGWLVKLRPWWGHDEHFHARLACPPESALCEPQASIPEGDGCGAELESWLAQPLDIPREKPHRQVKPLPAACTDLLRD
ncbi:penicillin-insensitive murein endopeptidase [Magnetospirillum molischianum]|nr:penicillin-insensitive murein endopeptidase [Magnetospirillum molischianum]